MPDIRQLDESQTTVVQAIYMALADRPWRVVRYVAKFTPTADVWSSDYDLIHEDGREEGVLPTVAASRHVNSLAHHHWKLTQDLGQPRWYKMIVTIERNGKFKVDFEYKDDYKEGDIMQRG